MDTKTKMGRGLAALGLVGILAMNEGCETAEDARIWGGIAGVAGVGLPNATVQGRELLGAASNGANAYARDQAIANSGQTNISVNYNEQPRVEYVERPQLPRQISIFGSNPWTDLNNNGCVDESDFVKTNVFQYGRPYEVVLKVEGLKGSFYDLRVKNNQGEEVFRSRSDQALITTNASVARLRCDGNEFAPGNYTALGIINNKDSVSMGFIIKE